MTVDPLGYRLDGLSEVRKGFERADLLREPKSGSQVDGSRMDQYMPCSGRRRACPARRARRDSWLTRTRRSRRAIASLRTATMVAAHTHTRRALNTIETNPPLVIQTGSNMPCPVGLS